MYIIWSPRSIGNKYVYVQANTVVQCKNKLKKFYKVNKIKCPNKIINKLEEKFDLEINLDIDCNYLIDELDNYVEESDYYELEPSNDNSEEQVEQEKQEEQEDIDEYIDDEPNNNLSKLEILSDDSNESEYNKVVRRKDYPINIFNSYLDDSLYIRKIDNVNDKDSIYILEYTEDGGGQSYHRFQCIYYEYEESEINKIIKSIYYEECENPSDEQYFEMLEHIKLKGWGEIEDTISNCSCGFTIYKL